MKSLLEKSLFTRILIISIITFADIGIAVFCVYPWIRKGIMIFPANATDDVGLFFAQSLTVSIPVIVLLFVSILVFKNQFADEMYLKVKGKYQRITIAVLITILLVMTAYCMIRQDNKIRIVLNLLYYLVFIAFSEEFVFRDVFTYLLKNEKAIIRYVVPSLMFSMIHVFAYSGWEPITAEHFLHFVTSSLFGLVAFSCIQLFIKEKTGTIWIPVLIHGILDYSGVLSYK